MISPLIDPGETMCFAVAECNSTDEPATGKVKGMSFHVRRSHLTRDQFRDYYETHHTPLVSSLTGRLNEVFEFTLEAEPGVMDAMSLRDLAEFEVKNRLLAVPGVAAVERLGGYLRQFQVQLDPNRMSARGISLDEIGRAHV